MFEIETTDDGGWTLDHEYPKKNPGSGEGQYLNPKHRDFFLMAKTGLEPTTFGLKNLPSYALVKTQSQLQNIMLSEKIIIFQRQYLKKT